METPEESNNLQSVPTVPLSSILVLETTKEKANGHSSDNDRLSASNDATESDCEDKAVEQCFFQVTGGNSRPSFTIGSDSDSNSATSVEGADIKKKQKSVFDSSLKPIPSGSENSSFGGPTNSRESLRGITNRQSPQNCNSFYANSVTAVSHKEIRLFASANENSSYTRRQWIIFIIFGLVQFLASMIISLQAPFYPLEAEKKGASATEFGLVFGIFELTVFLVSPIYAMKINQIGPKLVFNSGLMMTSFSAIAFGFLDKVDDRTLFVVLSILIRISEAIGEAAFIAASFSVISEEFPQAIANTHASMETFYGIGLVIGPLAGGYLYQIGGFTLPFLVVGGLLFISAIITIIFLPRSTCTQPSSASTSSVLQTSSNSTGGFKMFSLLSNPSIALTAFSIFSASASISYLSATLEPHIRQFSLTPVENGAIFIVVGGTYAIGSPCWGWLCDRLENHLKWITLFGCVTISLGFGLIGPIPYIPLSPTLWGVIVGQFIQGIGLGAVLVSAFMQSLEEAFKMGLPDNLITYSHVSGVWTSMFALGAFVGAIMSGVLFDIVGFREGTFSILGIQFILFICVLASMCLSKSRGEQGSENAPLLEAFSTPQNSSSLAQLRNDHHENKAYGAVTSR